MEDPLPPSCNDQNLNIIYISYNMYIYMVRLSSCQWPSECYTGIHVWLVKLSLAQFSGDTIDDFPIFKFWSKYLLKIFIHKSNEILSNNDIFMKTWSLYYMNVIKLHEIHFHGTHTIFHHDFLEGTKFLWIVVS